MRARFEDQIQVDSNELTADEMYEQYMPHELYRYHAINDYLFAQLDKSELWFSRPSRFNDPFDCRVKFNFGSTDEEIERSRQNLIKLVEGNGFEQLFNLSEGQDIQPETWDELLNQFIHTFYNERIAICCLSEIPDSILLWSHYANNHQGVCLEYHVQKHGFLHKELLPVNYYKEYPLVNMFEFEGTFYSLVMQNVVSKAWDWDYEYEWRAVVVDDEGLYPVDREDLRKVIFGVNTPKEDEDKLIKHLLEHGYDNVEIHKAVMNESKYEILFEPYEF